MRGGRTVDAKVAVLLAAVLLFFTPGCSGSKVKQDQTAGGLAVVTTIFPLADIVRQVGGENVNVSCLLPAGASPHTYEPTTAQLRAVASADLFVFVGGGLDEWAAGLRQAGDPGKRCLDLGMESGLLKPVKSPDREKDGADGSFDPHLWLDPLLVRDVLCPLIAETLSELSPEKAAYFSARLECYREKLSALHAGIDAGFSTLTGRRFISFHAAWSRFARRYHLDEIAVITFSPGQEPSAAWMAELVRLAREKEVRAILAESQFSPALAEGIAEETGAAVLIVDPLGGAGLSGRETYLDLIRYNAAIFQEALR